MARIAAAPQRRSNLALWALVLLGVGLLSLLPLTLLGTGSDKTASSTAAVVVSGPRIAYFAFDRTADTLMLADPKNPNAATKGLVIEHAPEYGVIPTLSPDGRSVAYLVLPSNTAAPGPDSPAQLWVATIAGGEAKLVASDADLLVPAVWTPDGRALVFRRSDNASSQLLQSPVDGSVVETELHASTYSLFPVAFRGGDLYFVELTEGGSVLGSADGGFSAKLSDGLTRDWALSPDGSKLAYLEMTLSGQQATSRAFVINLDTGERTAVGAANADAFNPAWRPDGSLVLGQLGAGVTSSAAVVIGDSASSSLAAPRRGFDVPLAANAEAGTAVTSFDGTNINNPGRASLVVVGPDSSRRVIASGEVTFLGWINP